MQPGTPTRKRIMIIEDDQSLRRLMQFGLQRAGYEILTAEHGGEAMSLLARETVDLILVDLMMPVVDGLRFLRWLRQEAQVPVPALVFTSFEGGATADEARSVGATDIVLKPVKLPELLERVRRLIGT